MDKKIIRKPLRAPKPIKYKVQNKMFVVSPIYKNYSGKPVHEILISLMGSEAKNLYK